MWLPIFNKKRQFWGLFFRLLDQYQSRIIYLYIWVTVTKKVPFALKWLDAMKHGQNRQKCTSDFVFLQFCKL